MAHWVRPSLLTSAHMQLPLQHALHELRSISTNAAPLTDTLPALFGALLPAFQYGVGRLQLRLPVHLMCRYPGGLKERPVRVQLEKAPEEILRRAVYGMLPKNNLRKVCSNKRHVLSLVPQQTARRRLLRMKHAKERKEVGAHLTAQSIALQGFPEAVTQMLVKYVVLAFLCECS